MIDQLARRILETCDALPSSAGGVTSEAVLLTAVISADVSEAMARTTLERLIAEGLLKQFSSGDGYVRTEDGRLAVAAPLDMTLYTRTGCHLCEEAKQQMAPLLREFQVCLREVDIDGDPSLRERYTNDVPVIFLGSRKVAKHRLDICQFRRQLERARS